MRSLSRCLAVVSIVAFTALGSPSRAHAQSEEVTGTAKGIVGGAFVGAEVVLMVEGAFRVRNGWALGLGALAGAGGGAAAGYFIGKDNPEAAVALLAGGLLLSIPTLIVVLSGAAYEPEDIVDDASAPPATTSARSTGT